jgi:hypothetical protein
MTLQFFLTEIVARLVAVYLCVDSIQILRRSFAERKIEYVESDWMTWLVRGDWVADRDATPIFYWMQICSHITAVTVCTVVAIFGWWVRET